MVSDRTIKPFTPGQEKIGGVVVRLFSWANVLVYRLSGGRIEGAFLWGAPVLLLTTIGRRSGQPRTVPLLYLRDGENVVVVGSKGGMSRHPLWYRNLEANPEVEIQIGSQKQRMTARRATEQEKAALWPRLVEIYRSFEDYQARTDRSIPVVILEPR